MAQQAEVNQGRAQLFILKFLLEKLGKLDHDCGELESESKVLVRWLRKILIAA